MQERGIIIPADILRDKVMGCWLGKNAGGALGEPLEEKFGREELFDIDWYPDLPEGGIPNDDLEMQLIWLQALREKGPGLTAQDLTAYWMDCIAYNFDEYGLSKSNMQKGLAAPVCGWHNNAFRDCMGSPIRSEIWACVAPGCPDVAAWYAFNDAICDHGGGESVYGEIYNAVVQSAAFVLDDKFALIDLGLRTIPEQSLTRQCIATVVDLHRKGVGWKDCRNQIKDRFYNPVAQYSPLNLGFQTIGWLYGKDFGDAICMAVNCGWDTDCTAATLGATLGILMGAKRLPRKWLEPLGDVISTNMTTGGIRNLTAPTHIGTLTDVVCEEARKVTAYWGCDIRFPEGGEVHGGVQPPSLPWMASYRPDTLRWELTDITASLTYTSGHAALAGDRPTQLTLTLHNSHPEPLEVSVGFHKAEGWACDTFPAAIQLLPGERRELPFAVTAVGDIPQTTRGWLLLELQDRPAIPALPVVLLGANRWLLSPHFSGATIDTDCGVPEESSFTAPPEGWREVWRTGNDLDTGSEFPGAGVVYAMHHIWSDREQPIVVGVPNNGRMKLWQDGVFLHQTITVLPLRPNLGNGGALGDTSNYCNTILHTGWNRFLVKLEQVQTAQQAHFTIGSLHPTCAKNHGGVVMGIKRSAFSWDSATPILKR